MEKNKYIVSFNLAGWGWKLTTESWGSRLDRVCQFIKENAPDAWMINLQEVILGKNFKYLEVIKEYFPDYVVVLPQAYDNSKNYKSAIAVTLINMEGYQDHALRKLEGVEDSLRHIYVGVTTDYGYFRIINAHVPTRDNVGKPEWYRKAREKYRKKYEKALLEEAVLYKNELDMQFLLCGDLNASYKESPVRDFVTPYSKAPMWNAILEQDKTKDTWINTLSGGKNHLDYILYSFGTLKSDALRIHPTRIIDDSINLKISDHAMLRGEVTTLIDNFGEDFTLRRM